MYIENMSELAFDDITPEDPDFPYIQGMNLLSVLIYLLNASDPRIVCRGKAILFGVQKVIVFLVMLHAVGLAEAGLIFSKLSRSDLNGSVSGKQDSVIFSPDR